MMKIELPNVIKASIEAKNAYDVGATLACFNESAVVYDESKVHHGKLEIKAWIEETIRKYQDQLSPFESPRKKGGGSQQLGVRGSSHMGLPYRGDSSSRRH